MLLNDILHGQTKKNTMEQWMNVQNAFVLKGRNTLRNKYILLIDDVFTLGVKLEA